MSQEDVELLRQMQAEVKEMKTQMSTQATARQHQMTELQTELKEVKEQLSALCDSRHAMEDLAWRVASTGGSDLSAEQLTADRPHIPILNLDRDYLPTFEPIDQGSNTLRCPYCPRTVSKYWATKHVRSFHPEEPIPKLPPHLRTSKRPRKFILFDPEEEPDPGYVKVQECHRETET